MNDDLLFSQALSVFAEEEPLFASEKTSVAIVGSRGYSDLARVRAYVMQLPRDTVLVSGGAEGVDQVAEETARKRGLTVKVFEADWTKYGNKAGAIRNQRIVDASDRVVAFWDGKSKGTQITMNMAKKKNIPCEVNPEPAPVFDRKTMIHFEQSRAEGTFSCYNVSTWTPGRVDIFKQWKDEPLAHADLVGEMADDIVRHLKTFFGGTVPPSVIVKPPRGKTPEDAVHAIEVLAQAVASRLQVDYLDCVKRNEADTTAHLGRSRINNLRDTSTFGLSQPLPSDKLVIILDDVSTTGRTLARMREALRGHPTIAFAYVIWH